MRIYLALLVIASLGACTSMESAFPNATKTVVDGQEVLVRQTGPDTYQALMNEIRTGNLMDSDTRVWPKATRAIEAVTGCKVIPEAIKNSDGNTIAVVSCN